MDHAKAVLEGAHTRYHEIKKHWRKISKKTREAFKEVQIQTDEALEYVLLLQEVGERLEQKVEGVGFRVRSDERGDTAIVVSEGFGKQVKEVESGYKWTALLCETACENQLIGLWSVHMPDGSDRAAEEEAKDRLRDMDLLLHEWRQKYRQKKSDA